MSLSKRIAYIDDYRDQANKIINGYGKTNLFSTGISVLDTYLGGGYGRKDGYEIVLLFGPTGVGKSTVGLNMLAEPIKKGISIGLLILEDDIPDVSNRLRIILGKEEYDKMNISQSVRVFNQEELQKSWTLNDLLEYIELWFNDDVDLIFLDHAQFAYENAESIKGENEYIAQRVFMQRVNQLTKSKGKTFMFISHQSKAKGMNGMDRIVGSSAMAQASTKVIEISEGDLIDTININLLKSRFTKKPGFHYCLRMVDGKLSPTV